jgi:biopolymer transport protein ExbD
MSHTGPGDDDEGMGIITDINVTPMVDIMLVLLIIFMVTASIIVSPSLKVELPRAGAVKAGAAKEPDVVVVVSRTGAMELRQKPLSPEQLLAALAAEHKARPHARLLILADKKAYHGNVVKVMNIAKSVGFERLGVAIDPGQ